MAPYQLQHAGALGIKPTPVVRSAPVITALTFLEASLSAATPTPTAQPDHGATSGTGSDSIQSITFGILATVIGIGGLVLAFAQVRKTRVVDNLLQKFETTLQ
jgi:hypothetical protein